MESKKNTDLIPSLQAKPGEVTELDPWDSQPGEHPVWYDRFNRFRLLGPNRSIREIYRRDRAISRQVQNKTKAIPLGSTREWNFVAARWQWEQRALAWDIYCQELQEAEANAVFNDGLSLVHKRVDELKSLAKKLKAHIDESGPGKKISSYIVAEYRETLNDIATELGHRGKNDKLIVSGPSGGPIKIETSWGRGGEATGAWKKQLDEQILETQITEVKDESIG